MATGIRNRNKTIDFRGMEDCGEQAGKWSNRSTKTSLSGGAVSWAVWLLFSSISYVIL